MVPPSKNPLSLFLFLLRRRDGQGECQSHRRGWLKRDASIFGASPLRPPPPSPVHRRLPPVSQIPAGWDPYDPVPYVPPPNPYDTSLEDPWNEMSGSDVGSDEEEEDVKTRVLRRLQVGQYISYFAKEVYRCPFCTRRLGATDFNCLVTHAENISNTFPKVGTTVNVHSFRAKHRALGMHLRSLQRVEISAGACLSSPRLPREQGQQVEAADGPIMTSYVEGSPVKALIVEDSAVEIMVLSAMLRRFHCEITIAKNGKEAVQMFLEGKKFDIIFCDKDMPVMSGPEAIEKIRTLGEIHVKIVGVSIDNAQEEFMRVGADEFLPKPMELDVVGAIIQEVIKKKNNDTPIMTSYIEGSSVKALIVEDSAVEIMVLSAMLRRFHCEITIAKNGKEAVQMFLEGKKFDIIFCDKDMPVMSGPEAIEKIRTLGEIHVKIVGVSIDNAQEEFMRVGADEFLPKPMELDVVGAIIQEVIKNKNNDTV
ncbi:hypothetical protein QYE76_038844 [Lolium multiflorum]|uniref:Response regulatory domain-containing protein n=1 Tax=Lolium multiflorum TaxID=4521 RepID=A0AAD8TAC4_LOLMU|nr:hypothetical protein QYE76_038844 [Lolium multiflorum]